MMAPRSATMLICVGGFMSASTASANSFQLNTMGSRAPPGCIITSLR